MHAFWGYVPTSENALKDFLAIMTSSTWQALTFKLSEVVYLEYFWKDLLAIMASTDVWDDVEI